MGNPNVLTWLLGRSPTSFEAFARREHAAFQAERERRAAADAWQECIASGITRRAVPLTDLYVQRLINLAIARTMSETTVMSLGLARLSDRNVSSCSKRVRCASKYRSITARATIGSPDRMPIENGDPMRLEFHRAVAPEADAVLV